MLCCTSVYLLRCLAAPHQQHPCSQPASPAAVPHSGSVERLPAAQLNEGCSGMARCHVAMYKWGAPMYTICIYHRNSSLVLRWHASSTSAHIISPCLSFSQTALLAKPGWLGGSAGLDAAAACEVASSFARKCRSVGPLSAGSPLACGTPAAHVRTAVPSHPAGTSSQTAWPLQAAWLGCSWGLDAAA